MSYIYPMIKDKEMKAYYNLIKEKGLINYSHIKQFLTNPDFYKPVKPIVLAFGTGGGKTFTTIIKLDLWYSNPENKGTKTVIFPHATNVLRANFAKSIAKYGAVPFSYCVVENSDQIESVFNSDCEVIIVLPQTLRNYLSKVSKIDWLIVDEAHEWYNAPVYQTILNSLRPNYQMLLTGTPSQFNNRPEDFYYHHISVDMLRQAGKLGNAQVHIVASNYTQESSQDIVGDGSVHSRVIKSSKTESSLYRVCKAMLNTLDKSQVTKGRNVVDTLFNNIDKTIIFCRTQAQAKRFYNILYKELDGNVLKSLSEDGGDSSEFITFENNNEIKVLILVRKGRLGFDMSNLYNIVDFTLTQSVDVISQMFGRILRPDANGTVKHYYKVSPRNTVWHYQAIMSVVLRLTMQDAYVIYDGNQNKIVVPRPERPIESNEEVNVDVTDLDFIDEPKEVKDSSTPHFTDIDPDLIMDLDFFKTYAQKTNQRVGEFDILTSCTLDDVRKEVLGLRDRRQGEDAITFEECISIAKERNYTKKIEFQYGSPAHYNFIQTKGLMDQFVKIAELKGRKLTLTYDECKEAAMQCNGRTDFNNKFQTKYGKSKRMGWLQEWFPEVKKSGPPVGHVGYNTNNFKLNK
jgi:superfamily II DNA or RNA helicase